MLAALLPAVAIGCADGQDDPNASGARLSGSADFQAMTVSLGGPPCPAQECGQRYELSRTGRLVFVDRDQRFEGQLRPAALSSLVALASSESLIASLRRQPGCPGVIHLDEITEIEILPGVFVTGETAGCTDGPPAALRHSLRTIARQLFPAANIDPGRAIPLPDVRARFNLPAPPAMKSMILERLSLHCSPPLDCYESLHVAMDGGTVYRAGPKPSGQFSGVTDFEPLASVVFRSDVLAALRTRSPCGTVTDLTETIRVFLGPSLFMRVDSAGCATGPIAELRTAAHTLVERLAAAAGPAPAVDAGSSADHPPDLSPR